MNYLKRKLRAMMNTSVVVPILSNYIIFSSVSSFTLNTYNNSKNWDGTLEYSTDTINWTTWTGTSISSAISSGTYKLYVRGTGNSYINTVSIGLSGKWVLTGSNISCSGRIDNLLDYTTVSLGGQPTMASNCYLLMFQGCTSLTTAPSLPATSLVESCYVNMFNGCTSLTTAPSLPANTLAKGCYTFMFIGCTSLTTAPSLPATTLASDCYRGMFRNCFSLSTAPSLPATTLANYCYSNMFNGCTSLTQAPLLPATTLATNCYYDMFHGCTSLTIAPSLPALSLAEGCYQDMFYGCSSLTTAPSLPATTMSSSCYREMFSYCTSLTGLPSLPATTLADYCYQFMFEGCSLIKLSTTQGTIYTTAYTIPSANTGTSGTDSLRGMFVSTGGTFTGPTTINTTYYTSNTVV